MLKPCSIRDRDSTAENGRTVKQTIRMSIARVNARCTSRGILTTTLFAIWPGRWDWCLNLARGRVLHSWFANLSDTVLHSPVINSRGRWLDLEASKPPSGGDGSIGVVRPGWCVSSEVRPASRQQPRVHMLHALRSEGPVMYWSSFISCVGAPQYHPVRGILCRCEANKLGGRVWN